MVQPLSGLAGYQYTKEATAEQRNGGTADPRHGKPGEQATPYPWEIYPGESHGPYGAENGLLGMEIAVTPAGVIGEDPTADLQPLTRAAPWPKGVPTTVLPDEVAPRRAEAAEIRGTNFGAARAKTYDASAVNDSWEEIRETDPGMHTAPLAELPPQAKGLGVMGWGSTDRTQSFQRQNEYGFDSAHMHRRFATGSIPGNYMWMEPGSRPIRKTVPGTAQVPVGEDSPFTGQNPGASYDPQGAVLMNLPVAYTGPVEPAVAGTYPGGDEPPAIALW